MASNKELIAAARKNNIPAIRNVLRPVSESVQDLIKANPPSPVVPTPRELEIQKWIKPDVDDSLVTVFVLRSGSYDPGRMGDCTSWKELEIHFHGEKIHCFHGDISGYEGDNTWLDMECSDLDDKGFEWYEDTGWEIFDYRLITPHRESDFRHVRDVLAELKSKGSVNLR